MIPAQLRYIHAVEVSGPRSWYAWLSRSRIGRDDENAVSDGDPARFGPRRSQGGEIECRDSSSSNGKLPRPIPAALFEPIIPSPRIAPRRLPALSWMPGHIRAQDAR